MNTTASSLDGTLAAATKGLSIPWTPILITLIVTYPLLCSFLRFRRRDAMERHFKYQSRESLANMTNDDAQKITAYMGDLEFPKVYEISLQFALFKTYGIPTISKLLSNTKQLGKPEYASKRYADTEVLITEFIGHAPKSPRTFKAIARMNFIHSSYQKAGKISNDDMLYTLSVFITEPIAWLQRVEWRSMTEMEICATATLWKGIGDAMNISYEPLGKSGWKDGIEFYGDIKAWAEEYEKAFMVPNTYNKKIADETTALLLFHVPAAYKPVGVKIVSTLLPDNLRNAMMYDKPSAKYVSRVNLAIGMRRFALRYLSLPRPEFLRSKKCSDEADADTGKYYLLNYQAHPFYLKPGLLNRWGPMAWITRALGGDVPGDKGGEYHPEGYNVEDVGPKYMQGKGREDMLKTAKVLQVERTGGCPFAFAR